MGGASFKEEGAPGADLQGGGVPAGEGERALSQARKRREQGVEGKQAARGPGPTSLDSLSHLMRCHPRVLSQKCYEERAVSASEHERE